MKSDHMLCSIFKGKYLERRVTSKIFIILCVRLDRELQKTLEHRYRIGMRSFGIPSEPNGWSWYTLTLIENEVPCIKVKEERIQKVSARQCSSEASLSNTKHSHVYKNVLIPVGRWRDDIQDDSISMNICCVDVVISCVQSILLCIFN